MNLELMNEHMAPLFLENNQYLEKASQSFSDETETIKRKIRDLNKGCRVEQVQYFGFYNNKSSRSK